MDEDDPNPLTWFIGPTSQVSSIPLDLIEGATIANALASNKVILTSLKKPMVQDILEFEMDFQIWNV